MCPTCMVEKKFNQIENKSKLKTATTYKCNYGGCNYEMLYIIQCGYTICDNWFHHLSQNEYGISEYSNKFDKIHGAKKCCKQCVDKLMIFFVNSINTSKNISQSSSSK